MSDVFPCVECITPDDCEHENGCRFDVPLPITYIELWAVAPDCGICGREVDGKFFVWRFEDIILPETTLHERGGMEVCNACYYAAQHKTEDFTKPILMQALQEEKPE